MANCFASMTFNLLHGGTRGGQLGSHCGFYRCEMNSYDTKTRRLVA